MGKNIFQILFLNHYQANYKYNHTILTFVSHTAYLTFME